MAESAWNGRGLVQRRSDGSWFAIPDVEGEPMGGAVLGRRLIGQGRGLFIEVRVEAGTTVPSHKHEHDSYCYLLSGKAALQIGDFEALVHRGDAFFHPQGVEHHARAIEDCHWLELKTPAQQTWTST